MEQLSTSARAAESSSCPSLHRGLTRNDPTGSNGSYLSYFKVQIRRFCERRLLSESRGGGTALVLLRYSAPAPPVARATAAESPSSAAGARVRSLVHRH
eukprot:6182403-Pleurochrysis_carterae.AAC.1